MRTRKIHHFDYHNGAFYCEDVPLKTIAEKVGTPCYIYSHATLTRHFRVFDDPFGDVPHLICYSMKANSNGSVLKLFLNMGSGVDIVSGGELFRALRAGADPQKIVYSGVAKQSFEIAPALEAGILMFNVESESELLTIQAVAKEKNIPAPISLRVNPDIDPKTHPYIATGLKKSKFGIPIDEAEFLFAKAKDLSHIQVIGVDCHIGSQITELQPFLDALEKMKTLIFHLRKDYQLPIEYLDFGGGLGIPYNEEKPPHPREYAEAVIEAAKDLHCTLIFEPGRVLVGNAGILLSKVVYLKKNEDKQFVIIDSGMNHLMRPTLYKSYQAIKPVTLRDTGDWTVDVVGPICESGDFFALDRKIQKVEEGDLLAIMSCGAYGYSMASSYNSFSRPPEVLVKGDQFAVIRKGDSYEDIVRGEVWPEFEL